MRHPACYTIPGTLLFITLFVLAGALLPLCLLGLTSLPIPLLMIQGGVSGLLFCGLVVILWYIIKFTRLKGNTYQRIISRIALICILLLVWQGSEHFLLFLFLKPDVYQQVVALLPCKVVGGVLLLVMFMQYYKSTGVGLREDVEEMEEVEDNEGAFQKAGTPKQESQPMKPTEPTEPRITTDTLTVKTGGNIHLIPVKEVLYVQAEGDYVVLYTATTRFIKEETMKHLESRLPASFVRIHRSCILNTEHISRIELYEKQYYRITLKTGQQVRASQSGYKLLKERLQL